MAEKAYTPPLPGAAPPQVPGQYAQPYPNQQFQPAQPPQYGAGQSPQPQPQPQPQQLPGQYAPNPQYQQDPQYNQPYPPQGQYPQQYPGQPPPQAPQGGFPPQPQPQYQQQPYQTYPPYTTVMIQQQPLPIIGMSVAIPGGNRNTNNLPRDALGRRGWSFGLCDCTKECGTCMMGLCCPCMVYAQIKQRVDYLNAYARPDPSRGGSGVDINCMVWVAVHSATGCGPALQAVTRGQLRNRYTIDGNGVGDFCTACWCTPCELTQEHRELDLEEQSLMK